MPSIVQARTRLVLDHPWLAGLVLRLDMIPSPTVSTLATDGQRVYYSQRYIDTLSLDELVGVLAHEALHCAMQHAMRCLTRDKLQWNIATDHAINLLLLEGGLSLPSGCLADKQYTGKSSEEIYHILSSAGSSGNGGNKTDCTIIPAKSTSSAEWQTALAAALHAAKKAGKLSASADRILNESARPKLDWRSVLAWHLRKNCGRDDYSWRKPSRRGIGIDIYLPTTICDKIDTLVVCIDTSGSMGTNELVQAVAEVRAIAGMTSRVIIIEADCEVKRVIELEQSQNYAPPKLVGGGGTDFGPAIAKALAYAPNVVVYITDLEGPSPVDPGIPILWVTQTNNMGDFGVTIKMED